jgi:hypothetical protein
VRYLKDFFPWTSAGNGKVWRVRREKERERSGECRYHVSKM